MLPSQASIAASTVFFSVSHNGSIFCRRVVDILRPKAESCGIALTATIGEIPVPVIQGDQKRLMQAIFNIVDNSIQHSPSGTNVVVEVHSLGEELNISVSDNGVGMSEVEVNAVREGFRQIEGGYTRSVDGIGLGLTLANMFIELHGGRINISAQKGEGTTVEMVIPGKQPM